MELLREQLGGVQEIARVAQLQPNRSEEGIGFMVERGPNGKATLGLVAAYDRSGESSRLNMDRLRPELNVKKVAWRRHDLRNAETRRWAEL